MLLWGLATLPPSKATADSPPQRLPNCTGCSKCLSEGNFVIEKDAKESLAQQKHPEVRQQDKCLRQKKTLRKQLTTETKLVSYQLTFVFLFFLAGP